MIYCYKAYRNKAELKWTGFDDPYANYHYEVEIVKKWPVAFQVLLHLKKIQLLMIPIKCFILLLTEKREYFISA